MKKTFAKPTVIITGGHHVSALVVAKDLQAKGWNVVWFGHRHSMWKDTADSAEYLDVTSQKIKFIDLKAGKAYRTYNPLKLIRIPVGFLQAFWEIITIKLSLGVQLKGTITFGGYLGVPVAIASWLLGVPVISHEQTVIAGWSNRLTALLSKKIAITWPESIKYYPPSKVVVTGLPIRDEILALSEKKVEPQPKISTIFVTGGKQGSHVINKLIFDSVNTLTQKYHIIHQTGVSSINNDLRTASSFHYPNYTFFGYGSNEMINALNVADLVISRAGAHTVYELALLQKKCILVPIPWSSHNEQYRNANLLVQAHQGIILPEKELSPFSLQAAIDQVEMLHPQKISLPTNAKKLFIDLVMNTFK